MSEINLQSKSLRIEEVVRASSFYTESVSKDVYVAKVGQFSNIKARASSPAKALLMAKDKLRERLMSSDSILLKAEVKLQIKTEIH